MRDNFSKLLKLRLGFAANYRCVRPGCCRITHALDPQTEEVVNLLGHAAHLSAASPGGPDYDELLSAEQRSSYDNGAWLCANCATVVDRQRAAFPVGTIKRWQSEAQAAALRGGINGQVHRQSIETDAPRIERYFRIIDGLLRHAWWPGDYLYQIAFEHLRELSNLPYPVWATNQNLAVQPALQNKQISAAEIAALQLKAMQSYGRYFLHEGTYRVVRDEADADVLRAKDLARLRNEMQEYMSFQRDFLDCLH